MLFNKWERGGFRVGKMLNLLDSEALWDAQLRKSRSHLGARISLRPKRQAGWGKERKSPIKVCRKCVKP